MRLLRTLSLLLTVTVALSFAQQTSIDLARQARNADFSSLSFTRPATVGSTLPATCTVGQMFFSTSANPGLNLYLCAAANVWSPIGNYTLTQAGVGVLGGVKLGNNSGLIVGTDGTLTANVGTSAGTLAAGNDARLQSALQASNNLSDLPNASAALNNLGGVTAGQAAAAAPVQSVGGKTGAVALSHADIGDFSTAVPAAIPANTFDTFGAAASVASASLSRSLFTASGDLITQGSGGPQRIPAGAVGYALFSNGSATVPSWQPVPAPTFTASAGSATTRSVTAKLSDFVSVLDFGADPTGVIDSTSAIRAALAAVPNGKIFFPSAHSSPGYYRVSSTLMVKRSQLLLGDEGNSTYINCSQTSSPCVVFADTAGLTWSHGGIRDLGLTGPGASGNTSVGLFIGGDPAGVMAPASAFGDFLNFDNIRIYGFNVGVEFGNNAYEETFTNALILNGATGVLYPTGLANSGELTMTFLGGSISDNIVAGITNNGAGEISLHGTAVDYNNIGVAGNNVWLYAFGCHFEQSNGTLISITGGTRVDLEGNTYLYTGASGSDTAMISFSNSYIHAKIEGGSAYSNHPVTYFVNAPGALSYNMHLGGGLSVGTPNIGSIINPATAVGLVTEMNGSLAAGSLSTLGTINESAAGSSASVPAILGFSSFSSGQYGQFSLGGSPNLIQSGYGQRMQMTSYYGIQLQGKTLSVAQPAFSSGTGSDASVTILGGTGDSNSALDIYNNAGTSRLFSVLGSGAFQSQPTGTQPACNATNRGTFWVTQSAAGTADRVQICLKNAANGYVWMYTSLSATAPSF